MIFIDEVVDFFVDGYLDLKIWNFREDLIVILLWLFIGMVLVGKMKGLMLRFEICMLVILWG